jgi:hypothetical protein
MGERRFEAKYAVCLTDIAREFARRSPHWRRLRDA